MREPSAPIMTTHQSRASVQHQVLGETWPRAAASAAIFRDGKVLIAERGSGPKRGYWSLPGGKIEPGETAADAAVREILEETGLAVEINGLVDVHNVIGHSDEGCVTHHYVICVYFGTSRAGEPVARTDVSEARFVDLIELPQYRLTDGALGIIHEAHRRLGLLSTC